MGHDARPDDVRLGDPGALGDGKSTPWAGVFVEQIVRPTGLVDPPCIIRPAENQVDDLMAECRDAAAEAATACWSPP